MTSTPVRYLTEEQQPSLLFSVCTLVASAEKYERLLASFEKFGFTSENTEFIALDNRDGNRFDGYRALRAAFPHCRGEFILYTHDDIELIEDGADDLLAVLRDLDAKDPNWSLAGNSGWTLGPPEKLLIHLRDPHGDRRQVKAPKRVGGLDESFLVMPRARVVFPSLDLSGFHLFATDMVEQSRFAGGGAYVIPFYLEHHSGGTPSPELRRSVDRFERKYTRLNLRHRIKAPAITTYMGFAGDLQRSWDSLVALIDNKISALGRKASALTGKPAGKVSG